MAETAKGCEAQKVDAPLSFLTIINNCQRFISIQLQGDFHILHSRKCTFKICPMVTPAAKTTQQWQPSI